MLDRHIKLILKDMGLIIQEDTIQLLPGNPTKLGKIGKGRVLINYERLESLTQVIRLLEFERELKEYGIEYDTQIDENIYKDSEIIQQLQTYASELQNLAKRLE